MAKLRLLITSTVVQEHVVESTDYTTSSLPVNLKAMLEEQAESFDEIVEDAMSGVDEDSDITTVAVVAGGYADGGAQKWNEFCQAIEEAEDDDPDPRADEANEDEGDEDD